MAFFEQDKEEIDRSFMRRCIQLAENGIRTTSPNPMVGALIVHEGKIIGEGYHIRPGEGHAEVNAIHAVKDKLLLYQSTLYVSLEPCSHKGRTPPCTDLIIQEGIPRVVIGCKDPFSKVNGSGIRKLEEAGIEVKAGILEKECINLNPHFMTYHSRKRPYIVLKWAESADGFIDLKRETGTPQIFSTSHTAILAHKHRAESKAILIGRRTALLDNPSLTVRHWIGTNPTRIVIDKKNRSPEHLNLLDGSVPTIIFNCEKRTLQENLFYLKINSNRRTVDQILQHLYKLGIQSLLVEGGSYTLQSFIETNFWDEAYVEISSIRLKSGVQAPSIHGVKEYNSHFGVPFTHYQNPNPDSLPSKS